MFKRCTRAAAALCCLIFTVSPALAAGPAKGTLDLHPPGEFTFAVTFNGGETAFGPVTPSARGAAKTPDGSITVTIDPAGLAPYAKVTVVEKTAAPVDFVITGMIDSIKIDEIEICGSNEMAVVAKVAAGARRLNLNRFAARIDRAACP